MTTEVDALKAVLNDAAWLTGVDRSITLNAIQYRLELASGVNPAIVADLVKKDAAEMQRLLKVRQDVRNNVVQAKTLSDGLAAVGIDPTVHNDLLKKLQTQANAQANAVLTDANSIRDLVGKK